MKHFHQHYAIKFGETKSERVSFSSPDLSKKLFEKLTPSLINPGSLYKTYVFRKHTSTDRFSSTYGLYTDEADVGFGLDGVGEIAPCSSEITRPCVFWCEENIFIQTDTWRQKKCTCKDTYSSY